MRIFVIGGTVVNSTEPKYQEQKLLLNSVCRQLGRSIAKAGHSAIVCSPFENSADLEVMRGFAEIPQPRPAIEIHYPDSDEVRARLNEVIQELGITTVSRYPYPPPQTDEKESWRYAWLLCQLNAIEHSQVTVAIGGQSDGSANMLLLLAEGKQKPLLPIPFLGGAANQAFYRHRYELTDRLGQATDILQDPGRITEFVHLADNLVNGGSVAPKVQGHRPRFFISYPRARPAEADYAETILRRRNMPVFRDETDFGAGHEIPNKIQEAIYSADVFVAVWCREYACSPWCFDELELALERHAQKLLELWILCVDETRIVPRRARDLVYYQIKSRDELEGRIVSLLDKLEENFSQKNG
jgi:hypothetical protein